MWVLFLGFIFLCLGAVAQAQAGGQSQETGKASPEKHYATTVSYSLASDGTPRVQVRVNDRLTGTFSLDTGWNNSTITDQFAAKLGLPIQTAHVHGQNIPYVIAPTLVLLPARTTDPHFHPLERRNVRLVVFPKKRLSMAADEQTDGIFGADQFSRLAVFWNFPQRWVSFLSPRRFTPEELASLGIAAATAVPLTDDGRLLFTAPVRLMNGGKSVELPLLVDTGSAVTIIPTSAARQLELRATVQGGTAHSASGTTPVDQAWLPTILIGAARLTGEVQVAYAEHHPLVDFSSNLGLNVLTQFYILIDYPGKTMYLQPVIARP